AAAAVLPNVKDDLLTGLKGSGKTYKVHLDGYNNLDYWIGKSQKSASRELFYYGRNRLDGRSCGRPEHAHRRETRRQLARREVISERSVCVEPPDGSSGEGDTGFV